MTFDEIRIALETRMAAWTDEPLAFDGRPAPPTVTTAQSNNAPWCRVSIQDGDSAFATHDTLTRRAGVLFVQVFTAETAAPKARQVAGSLAAHLEGYTVDGLHCRAASAAPVGPRDGYYQINVSVPWEVYG